MLKNKHSHVNSPWADWIQQVNKAKSFWSQNFLFNIVGHDPSEYDDTDDYEDVFYNVCHQKLSEYDRESVKASSMLSKKLKECKTKCEEFATLCQFMIIRAEKHNKFISDGIKFHEGYGDFSPRYDYEMPILSMLLQKNQLSYQEIRFIFEQINTVYIEFYYGERLFYESHNVLLLSDYLTERLCIQNKSDCLKHLNMSLINAKRHDNYDFEIIQDYFGCNESKLHKYFPSLQDWIYLLNYIDDKPLTKMIKSDHLQVLFKGFKMRTKNLAMQNCDSENRKNNNKKHQNNNEGNNKSENNNINTKGEIAYFDWLIKKCVNDETKEFCHAMIRSMLHVCANQNTSEWGQTVSFAKSSNECANVIKHVLSELVDDDEWIESSDVGLLSDLICVLSANYDILDKTLANILKLMLDNLDSRNLYQFLDHQRHFKSNLLTLIQESRLKDKNNRNNNNNTDIHIEQEIVDTMDQIIKQILVDAFNNDNKSSVESKSEDDECTKTNCCNILHGLCDILSCDFVSDILKNCCNGPQYNHIKCVFLTETHETTTLNQFNQMISCVKCFKNSMLSLQTASEAMKYVRNANVSSKFRNSDCFELYVKAANLMVDEITKYENDKSCIKNETIKSMIVDMSSREQIRQHFRNSFCALYFLEKIIYNANTIETQSLCNNIYKVCETFWHDRRLSSSERQDISQRLIKISKLWINIMMKKIQLKEQ